jgi:hypothetical protein
VVNNLVTGTKVLVSDRATNKNTEVNTVATNTQANVLAHNVIPTPMEFRIDLNSYSNHSSDATTNRSSDTVANHN